MTIYIDIVIAENLCMNYIILYTMAIVYKIKPQKIKLLSSSAIGSVYAVLAYTQDIEAYSTMLLKVLLSISMVYIAYSPKDIWHLIKQLITFYLISFVFGGVAFAMLYFIQPQNIMVKGGLYIGTYPIKIVCIGAIIGFVLIKITLKLINGKLAKDKLFCKVKVVINNNEIEINSLIDTGNMLKEPITGAPVIVIEKNCLEPLIPEMVLNNLDSIMKGNHTDIPTEYIQRFRAIPFSSLGKQNGMLLGIKPDKIYIETEDELIQVQDAIIGIYNGYITKNGLYSGLIGIDIFERRNSNEFVRIAEKQH
ncbi:MAG: sigma-E processing peptidase SpoIIGA [Clostridia bacterium]|nr:sigma-E processing peptidase SpoIIGA [Clostridia bacterium]